jgi:hypothetical protein
VAGGAWFVCGWPRTNPPPPPPPTTENKEKWHDTNTFLYTRRR